MTIEKIKSEMNILRHKWRMFSSNEDGVCSDTPDDVFESGFEACFDVMRERELKMIEILKKQSDLIEDVYCIFDNIKHYYFTQCIPTKEEVVNAENAKKRAQLLQDRINGILEGKEE